MKKAWLFCSIVLAVAVSAAYAPVTQQSLRGAWKQSGDGRTRTLVLIDDYFTLTEFDIEGRKFYYTTGGTARYESGKLTGTVEYHSSEKSQVGKTYSWGLKSSGTTVMLNRSGAEERWERTDDGTGSLAGNWRISGREQNGQMVEIKPAARKTIKLLSGQRFQWAAINTETGDFFGTGGGTYSFRDGQYTEHIEFFSRDSSRVGMSLSFNGRVEGRNWYHSGKSSRGEPISEVWSR